MNLDAEHFEHDLAEEFIRLYPGEAAARLESCTPDATAEFLGSVDDASAGRVLGRLTPDFAGRVLKETEPVEAGVLVAQLGLTEAATLLSRLEPELRDGLLETQKSSRASALREQLSYPANTAGALMDPDVLALRPEMTVLAALERLRNFRYKRIHRVFVTDSDQHLLGSVRLRDLAVAEPSATLQSLLLIQPTGVPVTAGREEVVEGLTRARTSSLPVVDFEGRLVGVIRHDTLIDAAREEATAGLQSMVGAGKEERALSKASYAVRKRLPWLEVNLATAFLAASVVGAFESTIARHTALAVLLPVVAGQSGNTGAQALAVTMRGLALREVKTHQWLRVCVKEAKVGLINGVAVALTTALAVLIWSRSFGMAFVICSSMVISMVAAGLSGATIPMVLTAIGQDPAQSSSIILTTVTDVVGFLSFLGIATLLSGML
jgi:magnesium transporter